MILDFKDNAPVVYGLIYVTNTYTQNMVSEMDRDLVTMEVSSC